MKKFKAGDRVRIPFNDPRHGPEFEGLTGTVLSQDSFNVRWLADKRGDVRYQNTCGQEWITDSDSLELLNTERFTSNRLGDFPQRDPFEPNDIY